MQFHQVKTRKRKSKRRVGRGGKKGTYSGRGLKGQKARAGKKPRAGFAGGDNPLSKLPKQRGATSKFKKIRRGARFYNLKLQAKPVIVKIKDVEKKFKEQEIVSPDSLLKKGLIGKIKGRVPRVKILGKSDLKKKLEFKKVFLSKSIKK